MRRYIEMFLALAFLVYGLIRLGVGSALLGQEIGLIDFTVFHEPLHDIRNFLLKSDERLIIPVSVAGYVSYIAVMGLVLASGALRTLKNGPHGLSLIGAFLGMYALLFVNFQTINPKIIHLGVCLVMFILLFWLKTGHKTAVNPVA